MSPPLPRVLERREFDRLVRERDGGRCVVCGAPAKDAHHIIERRLFADGGYHLDNGASVCAEHHMACETTEISVEAIREAAGITRKVLPDHLYHDQPYDKWGNPILPNGRRLMGDLFFDESVQKALRKGNALDLFTHLVKYPRTYHVPWSPGATDDDRILKDMGRFAGRRVIASEKLDGENTTLYTRDFHARSVDGRHHRSRDRAKSIWSRFAHDIPERWRFVAENMYARHSIAYEDLPSFLIGLSAWNEVNRCLSHDETVVWFALLGLPMPRILYDGIYDESAIRALHTDADDAAREGYVIRVADEFAYGEFRHCVAKYVRRDHVRTVRHWMHGQAIVPNGLAAEEDGTETVEGNPAETLRRRESWQGS